MLIRGVELRTEAEILAYYAGMREGYKSSRQLPGVAALIDREEARALEVFRRTKKEQFNVCQQ